MHSTPTFLPYRERVSTTFEKFPFFLRHRGLLGEFSDISSSDGLHCIPRPFLFGTDVWQDLFGFLI